MADDFDDVDYGDDIVSLPPEDDRYDDFPETDTGAFEPPDEGFLAGLDAGLSAAVVNLQVGRGSLEGEDAVSLPAKLDQHRVGASVTGEDIEMEGAHTGPPGATVEAAVRSVTTAAISPISNPTTTRSAATRPAAPAQTTSFSAPHVSLPPKPQYSNSPKISPNDLILVEARSMVADNDPRLPRSRAQDLQGSDRLPPGWDVRKSSSTGRTYYFHAEKGESLWERPTLNNATRRVSGETAAIARPVVSSATEGVAYTRRDVTALAPVAPAVSVPSMAIAAETAPLHRGYDHYSPPRDGRDTREKARDPLDLNREREPGRPPPRRGGDVDHYSLRRNLDRPPRRGRSPMRRGASPPPAWVRDSVQQRSPRRRPPSAPPPPVRATSPPAIPLRARSPLRRERSPPPRRPPPAATAPVLASSANKRPRSPSQPPDTAPTEREVQQPPQKRLRDFSPRRGDNEAPGSIQRGPPRGVGPSPGSYAPRAERKDDRALSPTTRYRTDQQSTSASRLDGNTPGGAGRGPGHLAIVRHEQEPRAGVSNPPDADRMAPAPSMHGNRPPSPRSGPQAPRPLKIHRPTEATARSSAEQGRRDQPRSARPSQPEERRREPSPIADDRRPIRSTLQDDQSTQKARGRVPLPSQSQLFNQDRPAATLQGSRAAPDVTPEASQPRREPTPPTGSIPAYSQGRSGTTPITGANSVPVVRSRTSQPPPEIRQQERQPPRDQELSGHQDPPIDRSGPAVPSGPRADRLRGKEISIQAPAIAPQPLRNDFTDRQEPITNPRAWGTRTVEAPKPETRPAAQAREEGRYQAPAPRYASTSQDYPVDSRARQQDHRQSEPSRSRREPEASDRIPTDYPPQSRYPPNDNYGTSMDIDYPARDDRFFSYNENDRVQQDRPAITVDSDATRYPERQQRTVDPARLGPVLQASFYRPTYDDVNDVRAPESYDRREARPYEGASYQGQQARAYDEYRGPPPKVSEYLPYTGDRRARNQIPPVPSAAVNSWEQRRPQHDGEDNRQTAPQPYVPGPQVETPGLQDANQRPSPYGRPQDERYEARNRGHNNRTQYQKMREDQPSHASPNSLGITLESRGPQSAPAEHWNRPRYDSYRPDAPGNRYRPSEAEDGYPFPRPDEPRDRRSNEPSRQDRPRDRRPDITQPSAQGPYNQRAERSPRVVNDRPPPRHQEEVTRRDVRNGLRVEIPSQQGQGQHSQPMTAPAGVARPDLNRLDDRRNGTQRTRPDMPTQPDSPRAPLNNGLNRSPRPALAGRRSDGRPIIQRGGIANGKPGIAERSQRDEVPKSAAPAPATASSARSDTQQAPSLLQRMSTAGAGGSPHAHADAKQSFYAERTGRAGGTPTEPPNDRDDGYDSAGDHDGATKGKGWSRRLDRPRRNNGV